MWYNTSLRRLVAYLLQQMVHYRTDWRGSGLWSTTITRTNIRTTSHTNTPMTSKKASESCAMEASCGDPVSQARLGAEVTTYSTSSGTRSGTSSEKFTTRVSTYVLSKSNHTHGGGLPEHAQDSSRIRLRLLCSKARFDTCKGLFSKRGFHKAFL